MQSATGPCLGRAPTALLAHELIIYTKMILKTLLLCCVNVMKCYKTQRNFNRM